MTHRLPACFPAFPKPWMAHFVPAWVASSGEQMDPAQHEDGKCSGTICFIFPPSCLLLPGFTKRISHCNQRSRVLFPPFPPLWLLSSLSSSDLCSVFKEESLPQQEEEKDSPGEPQGPPAPTPVPRRGGGGPETVNHTSF